MFVFKGIDGKANGTEPYRNSVPYGVFVMLMRGIEPPTYALRVRCSTS